MASRISNRFRAPHVLVQGPLNTLLGGVIRLAATVLATPDRRHFPRWGPKAHAQYRKIEKRLTQKWLPSPPNKPLGRFGLIMRAK
ncbi:hypothetical protein TBK1r_75310 [Stieleria magnilauensis]|uniref:Uncharacterized protein n=1 Tax=Stieleria magnilauensis TaxID=2527963 RepID=A0ABX5Y2J0_9BACT|nr:hypothetical protein TBK1r_75310 [Planctomycetes bacterium TBK1r]